jgi:release factor glutamine methyltransferase
VLEILEKTAKFFAGKGIESPRLNIDLLLAHVLRKKRMDLYMEFDRPLSESELDTLRELARQRAAGVPLQHLLGTVEFHGREFLCDKRALVPRPETEQFVELLLKLPLPAEPRCVDVGTGSGVIALTLAAERPAARVLAVDYSPDALALARENAGRLALQERVEFIAGDLFADRAGPFDLIAANLPYIAAGELPGLAREVQHDPAMALDGGADGLALIQRCISQARARLAPGGAIGLEIGHDQAERVCALLTAAGFTQVSAGRDYQGAARFAFAVQP